LRPLTSSLVLAGLIACGADAVAQPVSEAAATGAEAATIASDETPATRTRNPDPWESFNRPVFGFNDRVDRYALRPVAVVYAERTPRWMQTGVSNFFTNLFYPTTIVNQFLQGKFKQGSQDVARFVINSTLGWGGVLDVASGAHLPLHEEDFGQTMGWWGVPPGPFLMLPLLGPATVRDTPSVIADEYTRPLRWYNSGNERWFSLGLSLVSGRASLLPYDRLLREAYDPYVFMRDAFLQRREYQVRDGNVPGLGEDDDANWAEEALREDAEAETVP
jgi:phospholipid-binding lipoprotein MlaA